MSSMAAFDPDNNSLLDGIWFNLLQTLIEQFGSKPSADHMSYSYIIKVYNHSSKH